MKSERTPTLTVPEAHLLREHFATTPIIAPKLPDKKSLPDFATVFIKQANGTIIRYRLIQGKWYKESHLEEHNG